MGWWRATVGEGQRKELASSRVHSLRVICEDAPAVVITWDLRAVVRSTRKAASEGRYSRSRERGWGTLRLLSLKSAEHRTDERLLLLLYGVMGVHDHGMFMRPDSKWPWMHCCEPIQIGTSLCLVFLVFSREPVLVYRKIELFISLVSERRTRNWHWGKETRGRDADLTRSRSVKGAFFRDGERRVPLRWRGVKSRLTLLLFFCVFAVLGWGRRKLTLKVLHGVVFCFRRASNFFKIWGLFYLYRGEWIHSGKHFWWPEKFLITQYTNNSLPVIVTLLCSNNLCY